MSFLALIYLSIYLSAPPSLPAYLFACTFPIFPSWFLIFFWYIFLQVILLTLFNLSFISLFTYVKLKSQKEN